MAKNPKPGKVKTRLTPALSCEEASDLAKRFLQETASSLQELNGVSRIIAVDPPEGIPQVEKLLPGFRLVPQPSGGLGKRLAQLFEQFFKEGFRSVIALGADHPGLPLGYLSQAVEALAQSEDAAVLGPTEDGGYYLVGLGRPHPELFRDIPWSSPEVFSVTCQRAREIGLPVKILPPWYDIDRPEDLAKLRYNNCWNGKSE